MSPVCFNMARLCLLGLMLVVVMIDTVLGTGKIAVKVTRFLNPSGRDKNGNCCDGLNLPNRCPTGTCDDSFLLCGSSAVSIASATDCDYGSHKFNGQGDHNSNNFSDDVSLFSFDTWKGSVTLGVNVTDLDTDGEMIIDSFSVNFTSAVFPSDNTASYKNLDLTGERTINPTSLRVSITAYCDRYYYREDCSKRCVQQDNCDGHYGCDSSGDIVCSHGWTGPRCRQPVAGSVTDCDLYDGLAKTSWAGNVLCNSTQAIALNIASQNKDGGVSGSMKTQGETIPIGGSFNTTTKKLTLSVNKDNTSKVDIQQVLATRENDTKLFGNVYGVNESCKLELLQSSGVFDACGQGRCIRYGRKTDDFYCCCDDGTTAASCNASTTTTVTTQTPSSEMTSQTTNSTVTTAKTSLPTSSPSTTATTAGPTSTSNNSSTQFSTLHPSTTATTTSAKVPATSEVSSLITLADLLVKEIGQARLITTLRE
ncbi:nuclear pore complex protein DDB_G0274915-like [Haliotis rufescens]|uniref:nuclear pore complex protein DDB_G0274915-like n=1 Tax=Haliotis rufescens TaxID=6454 RepID=UPI00201F0971|nr:nuclear pore complex protein DDB_G0274915-like [Haliotis rufescens]